MKYNGDLAEEKYHTSGPEEELNQEKSEEVIFELGLKYRQDFNS